METFLAKRPERAAHRHDLHDIHPRLTAEQVQYSGGVGPATVSATLRGIRSARSLVLVRQDLWSLTAQPQTKTLTDLRQKPIGITGGLGATGHVALLLALEKAGTGFQGLCDLPFYGRFRHDSGVGIGLPECCHATAAPAFLRDEQRIQGDAECRLDDRDARRRAHGSGQDHSEPGRKRCER